LNSDLPSKNIDFIVTNPPYKLKDKFLKHCYDLSVPFALLLPLTALGAEKRVKMYAEHGLEVLVPDKRINFIYDGSKNSNWFHSAWFCRGVLPEKLVFAEMDRTSTTP
jgi:DNA modification methylase